MRRTTPRRLPLLPALLLPLLLALLLTALPARAERFEFIALGDMPYGTDARTLARFSALTGAVNARSPAFILHVGDIKSGADSCADEALLRLRALLDRFAPALIYTPGDNEWADCGNPLAGLHDPLERLAFLRRSFFSDPPRSLGTTPRALESQARAMGGDFAAYVENTRFMQDGVMVLTAHVVGPDDNRGRFLSAARREHRARGRANIAWLEDSFARAESEGARAIVLALQADMFREEFDTPGHPEAFTLLSPYRDFGNALKRLAARFRHPVLLIHGDSHSFTIHRPFRRTAPNLTALQVFGARDMHAVRVMVDPDDPAVFAFAPLLNPAIP